MLHFVRKTAGVTFAAAGDGFGIGGIAGVAAWALNDCRVPVGRKSRAEERVRTARRGRVRAGQDEARTVTRESRNLSGDERGEVVGRKVKVRRCRVVARLL